MSPLLSVIVPVYRVERYLSRCIKSIINQTYKNLEIILVDDGSDDMCTTICDRYALKDRRIKVIHKQNGGLSSARNKGLDIATGELVTFVDSDDYIEKTMYEEMINKMIQFNCNIACCGRYIKSANSETRLLDLDKVRVFTSEQALSELLIKGCIDEASWDKIYSKCLFDDIRFPEGEINEDLVVMPLLFSKAKMIIHVAKCFYYYWQTPDGITKTKYSDKQTVVIEHMFYIENYIKKYYPKLDSELSCFMARYSFDMLENLIGSGDDIISKYINDYKVYTRIFKKNFWYLLRSQSFSFFVKSKAFLMYIGAYRIIKKIVRK